ncbi:hypothetical protein [Bacillus sp. JCM 19041]|uniref:hypothetical protein n=1 Tax=Bacillus sp. JCM 19041 TaxID=1460637 RepID=UPI000A918855
MKQENNGLDFPLDLDEVVSEGQYTFRPSWYGTVLYAGEEAGFPIFTFSADWGEEVPVNAPSYEYLNMIAKGLREYVGLQPEEIVNYLRGKPGITGYIQDEDLWSLARSE